MRKKSIGVISITMTAVLALSSVSICAAAADVDVQPSTESGKIKFDKGNWNKDDSVCFYIWASKEGERDLYWVQGQWREEPKWASKKLIANNCEDPRYCEMEVDIMDGWDTFIIFHEYETNAQTFDCVLTPNAFGDTAHMSDELLENPFDSDKTCIGIYFDNADDCGSHKVITSTGHIVGNALAPNDVPELIVANALYKLVYKVDKSGEECCTQRKVNNWVASFGTTKEAVWKAFETFKGKAGYDEYGIKVDKVKQFLGIEDSSNTGTIFFEIGTDNCIWTHGPEDSNKDFYTWEEGDLISFFIWDATNGTYCTSEGWSSENSWGKETTYGTPVEGNQKLVESFEFTLPENHDVFIMMYNATHGGQTMLESTLNETAFGATGYLYTYPNDLYERTTLKFNHGNCGPCMDITDNGEVIGEYLTENDKSRDTKKVAKYLYNSLYSLYSRDIDKGCSVEKIHELIKVFKTTKDDVWSEFKNAYDEANADNEYYADIRKTAYQYLYANMSMLGTIGDLNYDGAVKASDSLIVQRAAINLVAVPDSHKPLADVNKDGKITASDALEILRYTLNLSKNENIGTAYTVYVFPEYDLEF